jgi:uncharacterized repeat protein (TIGR01451 family)
MAALPVTTLGRVRASLLTTVLVTALLVAAAALGQAPQPGADLQVAKTDRPDPITAGSNLTYTVTVRNNGPDRATGVRVTDTVPAGTTFVSANASQGNCTGTTPVTCNLGALGTGETATVTMVVRPRSAGTITNTARAQATQTDAVAANNVATETTTVNPRPTRCTITGTTGHDVLLGTSADDIICALAGDDVVRARGGRDIVRAGLGSDVTYAGAGNDVVSASGGQDVVYGGFGNDRVLGAQGPDVLYGQPGNDFLHGGRGFDVVNGGPGIDTCRRGLDGALLIAC